MYNGGLFLLKVLRYWLWSVIMTFMTIVFLELQGKLLYLIGLLKKSFHQGSLSNFLLWGVKECKLIHFLTLHKRKSKHWAFLYPITLYLEGILSMFGQHLVILDLYMDLSNSPILISWSWFCSNYKLVYKAGQNMPNAIDMV